jgi:protein Mpv17
MPWKAYQVLLRTHPWKTKALTSSFITGFSDVCLQVYEQNSDRQVCMQRPAQQYSEDSSTALHRDGEDVCREDSHGALAKSSWLPDLEVSRTLTLAAVGLIYSGPLNHLWFASLEKLIRTQHQMGSVMLKLVVDQVMFVPVAISGYLTVRGVLEHKSESEIHAQLQEKLVPATQAAWQFWPFVNLISFSVVPVMYRVLFGNVCAIFWNARLSSISSQRSDGAVAEPKRNQRHTVSLSCGNLAIAAHTQLDFMVFMTAVMANFKMFMGTMIDKLLSSSGMGGSGNFLQHSSLPKHC